MKITICLFFILIKITFSQNNDNLYFISKIVDKDTLLSTISHSYGSHDISMQYGNYGFLKRKK